MCLHLCPITPLASTWFCKALSVCKALSSVCKASLAVCKQLDARDSKVACLHTLGGLQLVGNRNSKLFAICLDVCKTSRTIWKQLLFVTNCKMSATDCKQGGVSHMVGNINVTAVLGNELFCIIAGRFCKKAPLCKITRSFYIGFSEVRVSS